MDTEAENADEPVAPGQGGAGETPDPAGAPAPADVLGPARGVVKWFDVARGFGFVVSEELDRDVLLHVNVLRNYGQSSVADGSAMEFTYQVSDRGLQVVAILSIEAPVVEPADPRAEYMMPVPDDLPYLPARVKWFDKAKGFGFANVFGSDQDIFVHVEVLRRFGLADLIPGEAVCIRVMDGARGKLAVEVRRWEDYVD